jgi:DNA modification methylase
MNWLNKTHVGDCRLLMRSMVAAGVKVQCVVSSPPYWGLRDYGVAGQFGLERTFIRHVARIRSTFRLVRSLLADDGVLWLNYGDSYAGSWGAQSREHAGKHAPNVSALSANQVKAAQRRTHTGSLSRTPGLKAKDLMGMPWRIAFALQADGWWLRSDIIWHKPTAMPESTQDRPTKAHEYLFLMTKSARYHYDATAIAEPRSTSGAYSKTSGWAEGGQPHTPIAHSRDKGDRKLFRGAGKYASGEAFSPDAKPNAERGNRDVESETRNARSVWTISSEPFAAAHFATFPRELVRRCILAGSREGDVIFDPFMGSGTVAEVALSLGRQFIGCELNPAYAAMGKSHRSQQTGMAV